MLLHRCRTGAALAAFAAISVFLAAGAARAVVIHINESADETLNLGDPTSLTVDGNPVPVVGGGFADIGKISFNALDGVPVGTEATIQLSRTGDANSDSFVVKVSARNGDTLLGKFTSDPVDPPAPGGDETFSVAGTAGAVITVTITSKPECLPPKAPGQLSTLSDGNGGDEGGSCTIAEPTTLSVFGVALAGFGLCRRLWKGTAQR